MENQQHFYKHFPVSEEDRILLESLDSTGLLQNTREMEKALKKLQLKAEEEKLQPYSDLLFSYIKDIVSMNTESIKADLLRQLKEGQKYPSWVLLEFNSVLYYETLDNRSKRFMAMTPEERMEFHKEEAKTKAEIKANGYDWRIGTTSGHSHGFCISGLPSVRLERIIRKTDIKRRLANLFGTSYKVYLESKGPVHYGTGYASCRFCLRLTFNSKGPSQWDLKDIVKVQKKYLAHTPYELYLDERIDIQGHLKLRIRARPRAASTGTLVAED